MSDEDKVQEVIGRAAVDHEFCHLLVKSSAKACRDYELNDEELEEVKSLLGREIGGNKVGRKVKAALATAATVGALLLSTSVAYADDCRECDADKQLPTGLRTATEKIELAVEKVERAKLVGPDGGVPGLRMATEKIEIAVEKVERAKLLGPDDDTEPVDDVLSERRR